MDIERRVFLSGALSALSLAALGTLSGCVPTPPAPTPTPTPTTVPGRVPAPAAFVRSAWSTDPYSLGSFSMIPAGGGPGDRATLRETVGGRVLLAGEATSSEFPGTLRGAAQSGESAADRVAAVAAPGERIAVVGAGLAGATAARALTDAGFDVVVIEARDRLGGRIDTRQPDGWAFPVELGAATVGLDALSALRSSGVDSIGLDSTSEIRTAGGTVVPGSDAPADAVTAATDWARTGSPDISLAAALAESGAASASATATRAASATSTTTSDTAPTAPTQAELLTHYLDTFVATAYGAGAFRLSAAYGLERGAPGIDPAEQRLVVGGLGTVVSDALDGLDVLLGATVVRVGYDDEGVSLRFGTGESLSVDRVVVTVPLGVLQAGTIEFDPPLPEVTTGALESLGMGTLEQLWLRFDTPFWSADATVLSVLGDTSVVSEWVNLLPATGQPVLVGLTAADAVGTVATQGDAEFVSAALQTLEPFVDESLIATSTPTPVQP
ncbi:FAD-dependent oxidoreductase [Herbiconiux moechotypicola]|uniref:Amine oxidase domain-containing protein n=1 Tax=Herbiconiux moechotypicola TaxID=637393 RepID=A0ABN3DP67_9MICO|nr:FAD-dependent oxidoreductase [Herbiconiux moechotypicola]MCS5730450.1 FAD-dependent oxidoreductase [Herbiconiux moechotypicola]